MWTVVTSQKMKFSIKDFFSKCDQIRSFLGIGLLKKSLMKNYMLCAVRDNKATSSDLNLVLSASQCKD